MPVNTKREAYKNWICDWELARAVLSGERAVKDPGMRERTIPRLSGHVGDDVAYNQYVDQAHFFPGAGRYREGLLGLLFQVRPTVEVPSSMARFLEDVTGSDSPCTFGEFIRTRVGRELATTGRVGILTDYPVREAGEAGDEFTEAGLPRDLTVAQAERRGVLPTLTRYRTEAIINWAEERISGRKRTVLIVLEENKTVADPEDRFVRQKVKQWRVLELARPPANLLSRLPQESDPARGGDGLAYRVQIYRQSNPEEKTSRGPDAFEVVSTHWPRRNGQLMPDIQFDVVGADDCELGDEESQLRPPLMDVVRVNLGHLRNSAMYEHSLLFVGSPQPYITGYDEEEELGEVDLGRADTPLAPDDDLIPATRQKYRATGSRDVSTWKLGSSQVWLIKSPDATPGYMSAKSSDVSALAEAMERKQEEMVVIGGRLLARDKLAAEAARTEEIRREGERGVVTVMGENLANSATRWLTRARDWMLKEGEVRVEINTDFLHSLDPAAALSWSELRIRGDIAREDMNDLFRRSRVLRPERTDEEVKADILAEPPMALPGEEPLLLGEDEEELDDGDRAA